MFSESNSFFTSSLFPGDAFSSIERIILLFTGAGLTVFTLILCGAASIAVARIMPTTACLLVTYALKPAKPKIPATDEVIMILPPSFI